MKPDPQVAPSTRDVTSVVGDAGNAPVNSVPGEQVSTETGNTRPSLAPETSVHSGIGTAAEPVPDYLFERLAAIGKLPQALESMKELMQASRDNIRRAEGTFTRFLGLTLLLGGGYLLCRSSILVQATLGPFTLTDIAWLQRLLPLAVAYCCYELSLAVAARLTYQVTFGLAVGAVYPLLYRYDLENLLLPASTFTSEGFLVSDDPKPKSTLMVVAYLAKSTVLSIGPLILAVYCAVDSVRSYGWRNYLALVFAAVSLALVAIGFFAQVVNLRKIGFEKLLVRWAASHGNAKAGDAGRSPVNRRR